MDISLDTVCSVEHRVMMLSAVNIFSGRRFSRKRS
jgi:hypothetical protein